MMIQALHSLYQQHTDNGGHGIGRCGGKGKHRGQHHNGNNEHCCHGERGHHQERHGECCQQGEQSHEHNGHADHGCCHGEKQQEHGKRHGRGCGAGKGKGRGQGRQLKRMFDHGDLRVLLLSMIAAKPSHGYEIIRGIDEASSGLYVPSPGVIYPTLTLLEEQDLVVANIAEKGRKNYSITPKGSAFLAENQETEKNIQNKLAYARDLSQNAGGVSEEIEFAVGKLKAVLRHKLVLKQLSVEKAQRIAFILNEAVEKIEAINEALISEVREDE